YYGAGLLNVAAAVAQAASSGSGDATPPSVAIASPTGGTVSGSVAVSVTASDNVGVTRVELRVNGSSVASDSAAPYQFTWDSTTVSDGAASLTAAAFDAAGNSTVSTPVSVNVANSASADTTPPSLAITSPANGVTVSGNVSITTSVSDNSGAAGITQKVYIDGILKKTVTGSALNYRWNTRQVASGAHTISVTATDAAGNTAT